MSGEKTILGPTLEIEGEIEGSEDLVILINYLQQPK